jgi:MoaA/NifB/PqqE/SkfB family radical SAM enzyme
VIDELAVRGRTHNTFNRYNEPLNDPRLFIFIAYVYDKLPKAKIFIFINGYYLTQEILNEFEKYDISKIQVSSYSKEEHERLKSLRIHIPYTVISQILDERDENNCKNPRYATIRDITINCNGV